MTLRRIVLGETNSSPLQSGIPGGFLPIVEIDDATGTITSQGNIINTSSGLSTGINNQAASYQLQSSDAGGYIRMNVSTANNLTVPADSTVLFITGTVITIRQVGAGQTTVVAAGGVTISSPSTLGLRAQNSTVQLIKVAANTWDLAGDVA